jgi:membrane protease subunit HflC
MKKVFWWIGGLVVLVILIAMFTFTVNETDYAVVTQFGRAVRTIEEPGLKMKWPAPIQRVHRFDGRLQLFEGRLIELLTEDKKNIIIKSYVCWQISNPMEFFQSVGSAAVAEQKLEDILISKGGAAIGDFEFEDLISVEDTVRIAELEKRIEENLREQTLRDYGIEIVEVGISRLALPEANAYSVYNRMKAEREAIANKYRAEGKEQAAIIRAAADREKSDIISEAYRESQMVMGEGEAEAARIYSEAFSRDPEFYQFWRTMETYRKILDEKTTLILSEDSELFKYLRN